MKKYSLKRLGVVIWKEFLQILRDRGTLAMIMALPFIQIILFGYAINTNPHQLPTVIVMGDESIFTRDFIKGLENSDYFRVVKRVKTEAEAENLLATGKALFVLNIPPNFSRDFVRGDHPSLLLEADATDSSATGQAICAAGVLTQSVFKYHLQGALSYLLGANLTPYNNLTTNIEFKNPTTPVDLRVHARYNPAAITQLNIVPALIGVILTMTMVMITAIAIVREREQGTMENLLATPIQPAEVMIGKVLPYVIVGYLQLGLVLTVGSLLFAVPIMGSILLLLITAMPFIAANLTVGLVMSTIAKNQVQAGQMATFFFLPSILLSGFMFPFAGMPVWAQWIGQALPLTHFLRIVRGILLKGNGWTEIWPDVWPMLLFLVVMLIAGIKFYRKTLD